MAVLLREGLEAGALGFSTSRTLLHRAKDGEPVPGTFAAAQELLGLGRALQDAGHGVFELASDLAPEERELDWMVRLAEATGRVVSFALLQNDADPEQWRRLLAATERAAARGARLVPQVSGRPTGLLLGLESSYHPFALQPSYRPLAGLPLAERVVRMRDPELRRRLLGEKPELELPITAFIRSSFQRLFPLGDPPDYEPPPERSVRAMAEREGRDPRELAYDLMLEDEGRALLYFPLLNYAQGDFEAIRTMLLHPNTVLGLSDGGAHCGILCDAGMPTFMLTHWVLGRSRGERLPLEAVVASQTRDTARLYGLLDRGQLAPGFRADVNLIDLDALALLAPRTVFDLPAGGRRLVQEARGYRATVQSGQVTFEDGEPTGALPGRLVRGPQPAPA
jgi:N-acyl-D-aspartate/D-glutamate deacylase